MVTPNSSISYEPNNYNFSVIRNIKQSQMQPVKQKLNIFIIFRCN